MLQRIEISVVGRADVRQQRFRQFPPLDLVIGKSARQIIVQRPSTK